jgi:hypothetical protein
MNVIFRRLFLVILLTIMLVACSSISKNQSHTTCVDMPPQPHTIESSQVGELMRDYEDLRAQPTTELAQEYKKAAQDFAQTGSDSSRMRVAMLLALPDTSFHDTSAAINLLNTWPIDENSPHLSLRGLAHFLSVMLMQQRRSINTINDLAQELKEKQKHAEILQDKIDSIKDMEKNLLNRSTP